jgi:Tol biopolymer transport system component
VSPLRYAVVFSRFLPGADQGELYQIDAGATVKHAVRSVNDAAILSPSATRFLDFAPTPDDRGSTAIFNVDGSGYRVLPIPDPALGLPGGVWSAGDTRVATEGWGLDGDPHGVSIYSRRTSDGGGLIRLTDAGTRHDYPVKSSPDGSELLFFRPDAKDEISDSAAQDLFVVGADGHGLTRLSPPGMTTAFVFSGASVSWSPDSTKVSVVLANGPFWNSTSRSVYIANEDGSGLQRIGPRGDIWNAVWSPDGRWIAFSMASRATGRLFELYLMHPDGSEIRRLTFGADDGLFSLQPVWSPDSGQLLFVRGTDDVHVTDIWSVNADGSQLYQVTHTPSEYRGVAWLPDSDQ